MTQFYEEHPEIKKEQSIYDRLLSLITFYNQKYQVQLLTYINAKLTGEESIVKSEKKVLWQLVHDYATDISDVLIQNPDKITNEELDLMDLVNPRAWEELQRIIPVKTRIIMQAIREKAQGQDQELFQLCFVEELDWYHHKLWFVDADPSCVWGDDWDKSPYEHNAGFPLYTQTDKGAPLKKRCVILQHSGELTLPNDSMNNSPYSVQMINKGAVPWIRLNHYHPTKEGVGIYAGATFIEVVNTLEANGVSFSIWKKEEGVS